MRSLTEQALALRDTAGGRVVIGITGPPGAGKSNIAAWLAAILGTRAALVPMDGFHLPNATLDELGRRERKGAPDTFDVTGYVEMLARLRIPGPVMAPAFDRATDEPVAEAIVVPPEVDIVFTEGNYLLAESDGWEGVRPLLDAVWYLDIDEAVRLERLIARHVEFGKTPEAAEAWAKGPDAENAVFIASMRDRADLVVTGA